MKANKNGLKAFFSNIIEGDIKKADVIKDRSKLPAYRDQQSDRMNTVTIICFIAFAVLIGIAALR